MDHEQAIQTQASMRYALGELTPDERDSFEEHFADCSHCMSDVELASAFAANAKEVFRERALWGDRPKGNAWLRWRPFPALALSAALNLVLVAGLGYGLLRFHRAAPGDVAQSAELESVEIIPVRGTTRGSEGPAQVVRVSRRPIVLTFDLPQRYEHYFYSIDRDGAAVLSGEVSVPGRPDSLNLQIQAARLSPGEYQVTVTGSTGAMRESLGTCLLQVLAR
jgi:hypothetical protein